MTRLVGFSRFALLLATGVSGVAAAPVEHRLESGLVYVRVHTLATDLPTKPEGRALACVLDLRFVDADADGATAFGAWLKFRTTPHSPLFVLVNSGTSPTLLRALRSQEPAAGTVVIGRPSGQYGPDLEVKTSPENEKKAYDAFENGTAIGSLIVDNPDKVRIDEASLAKERAPGSDGAMPSVRPAPAIDAAVQRAVHLYRSLVALKKV